jgi:hypothetical protein
MPCSIILLVAEEPAETTNYAGKPEDYILSTAIYLWFTT